MRALLLGLSLLACATATEQTPPKTPPPSSASAPSASGPATASLAVTLPASVPASVPASAPDLVSPRTVVATFVEGDYVRAGCGIFAFVGTFVYQVEVVEAGPPLTGKINVEVLCPGDLRGVNFAPGARHRLTLGVAKKTYAQSPPPKSPQPSLPRFHGVSVVPVLIPKP